MAAPEQTTCRPDGERKPATLSITLPKAGDAVRGVCGRFAVIPVTGTGSATAPIAILPGHPALGRSFPFTMTQVRITSYSALAGVFPAFRFRAGSTTVFLGARTQRLPEF